jgi:SAM-dependent methyltransferase
MSIGDAVPADPDLPPDFLAHVRALEGAYLRHQDPIVQSGFGGGPERWRAEREPILDAVTADGDILDAGCANGYLLECFISWGSERGRKLVPHGVDIGPRLIELARKRLPQFGANFHVANVWDWSPPRRFRYVYTLHDCVPPPLLGEYAHRLLERAVERGGRLIVGAYGSRSRAEPPVDIAAVLGFLGFDVAGESSGGDPVASRFAWIDRP